MLLTSNLSTVVVHSFRNPERPSTVWLALLLAFFLPMTTAGQRATLTDDAQVSANSPNQNFGSRVSVQVSGINLRGFIQFKITPNLPNGTTGGQIEKAILKLFVSAVGTPGNVELYRVTSAWDEGTVTNNTAPTIWVVGDDRRH